MARACSEIESSKLGSKDCCVYRLRIEDWNIQTSYGSRIEDWNAYGLRMEDWRIETVYLTRSTL